MRSQSNKAKLLALLPQKPKHAKVWRSKPLVQLRTHQVTFNSTEILHYAEYI